LAQVPSSSLGILNHLKHSHFPMVVQSYSSMAPEEAAEGSKPINGNELPIWTRQLLCVQFMFFFMMLTQQILCGAIFDVFLLIVGGTNTFVGTVESMNGIAGLLVMIVLGWVADTCGNKVLVVQVCSSLVIIFDVWQAYAIANEIQWMFVSGAVVLVSLTSAIGNLIGVIISDLTREGQHRLRALKWNTMFLNLASFIAPMTQYIFLKCLGKQHWTVQDLQPVLLSGTLFMVPFMICTFMLKPKPKYQAIDIQDLTETQTDMEETNKENTEETEEKPELEQCNNWIIIAFLELFVLGLSLSSGMMFKYWPLFFKKDLGLKPDSVCLFQGAVLLGMTFGNYVSSFFVNVLGRMPVMYICQSVSCMFLCMVATMPFLPVHATLVIILLRNTIQHIKAPSEHTMLMDALPPQYRARWTILASMKRMSWSGSAWVGGILSDHHGYRMNFFVCAVVQFSCQIFLIPISVLQCMQRKRQRTISGWNRQ